MDLNDVTEQTSFEKEKENEGSVYTGFVDHIHKITGIFKQLDKTSL